MPEKRSKGRRGHALRSRPPKGRGAAEVQLALRSQILHLELKPGAKLDEMRLVRQLGISRTPVREALIRLAAEGLVFLLPNRGAQVAPLDLVDIAQYFEALELVQRAINRCAALRRSEGDLLEIRRQRDAFREATRRDNRAAIIETNRDLHLAIAKAAHNSHLEAAMGGLLNHGMRLNWICHERFNAGNLERHNKRGILEHDRIVRAIERRDALGADRLGRVHTESFRQRVKDFLSDSFTGTIAIGALR